MKTIVIRECRVITVAILLLSGVAAFAGGILKYCTAQPNGTALTDNCIPVYNGCLGYCVLTVATGRMMCENSFNPYCGGTSYVIYTQCQGKCEGGRLPLRYRFFDVDGLSGAERV